MIKFIKKNKGAILFYLEIIVGYFVVAMHK